MDWNLDGAKGLLEGYVERGLIPGAALAIVTPEEAKVAHVGYRSLVPEKVLLEEDAIYDLASVSKVVATTTMALRCIEKGHFSLQSTVQSILPEFPHPQVTIEHLMTHTSGVCGDDKAYKTCRNKEELKAFFFEKPLEFEPGTKVLYSDFGYILLGFVIEKFHGTLDAFAQEQIFRPLEMEDTGYRPADRGLVSRCVPTEVTEDRGVVQGIVHDGKALRLDGVSGNAGVFSTARDLSHFLQMFLGNGAYHGRRILSTSTVALLRKCYTPGLNLRRTLGWIVDEKSSAFGDYYSPHCLFHTGFTGTSLYLDFDRSCGIVLLTNRVHPTRENPNIKLVRDTVHNRLLMEFDALR